MFPLFETIKIFNGKIYNLEWHKWRFEKSYRYYFGKNVNYRIEDVISLPEKINSGLLKLRFSYNLKNYKLEYEPFRIRKIRSLKIIEDNTIEYSLKYSDRNCLETLLAQKENCDDILIVKNGIITDTSFSNIIFFDGEKWKTPKTPLLKGTCRERLINKQKIFEEDIKVNDLWNYKCYKLINAMRDFHETESISISSLY